MRTVAIVCALSLFVMSAIAGMKLASVSGDVTLRRGADLTWQKALPGMAVTALDAVKTGPKSSALLSLDGAKQLSIPDNVILYCADFRILSSDELLMKLAIEGIKAMPARKHEDNPAIPSVTTLHGADRTPPTTIEEPDRTFAGLELNGVKVLYRNGYYATCVLRAKEAFRLDPSLLHRVDERFMVADALEKLKLSGEALEEYQLLRTEPLTPEQQMKIEAKVRALSQSTKE